MLHIIIFDEMDAIMKTRGELFYVFVAVNSVVSTAFLGKDLYLSTDISFKSPGSTRDGTGVSDSIVNQLLSKIDGVDSLNNILIIGALYFAIMQQQSV